MATKQAEEKVTFEKVKSATSSDFDWRDISEEQWRKYTFPDGDETWIHHPVALSLKTLGGTPKFGGGAHRIVDVKGHSHYVPRGWVLLSWKADPFYVF